MFSQKVEISKLNEGDHVYTWRKQVLYTHHGIYVGENKVIHFTAPENYKSGFIWNFSSSYNLPPSCLSSVCSELSHPTSGENDSSNLNLSSCPDCLSADQNIQASCLRFPDCGFKVSDSGVIISCLKCFIGTGNQNLYLYRYEVKKLEYVSKVRGGTCTIAKTDLPQEVIRRAMYLLQNSVFGDYNVVRNNCEDFALYCKTGLLIGGMPTTGSSGQVNFLSNAPWKTIIISALPKIVGSSSVGGVTVAAGVGLYCYNRYNTDIGVRDDVVKVQVEDMLVLRAQPGEAVNGDLDLVPNAAI